MESVFITTRKQRIIREMRDYMMIALGMLMYSIYHDDHSSYYSRSNSRAAFIA